MSISRTRPRTVSQTGIWLTIARLFLSLFPLLATSYAAHAEPKSVLILHSFGRDFAPWNEYARVVREEFGRQSSDPINIFEVSLATARFPDENEAPFVDYLRALFNNKRQLDLILTIGAPAAAFFQKHRQNLFPGAPVIYGGVEERHVQPGTLTANDAAVVQRIDFKGELENVLKILPGTKHIAVVLGSSPIERYWAAQMRDALQPFEDRLTITWFNELSFEEMLRRAATLPPHSIIYFALLSVDAAGVSHEGGKAIARLHAVANAPIFSYDDTNFGKTIVGGVLTAVEDIGRETGRVAFRILAGESPGSIGVTVIKTVQKYDWRELQRWNISESNLPAESDIQFRELSVWQKYRPQFLTILALIIMQATIISWLLFERRRRFFAEAEAGSRRRETARLNRVATVSVLSTSMAHELNQPLGSILNNSEAARVLLRAEAPDLKEVDEILSDIIQDNQRASTIISGLRDLIANKKDGDLRVLDLNRVVRDVVRIVTPEAAMRKVRMSIETTLDDLPVRSAQVQLQQVILNLVMNGLDALGDREPTARNLIVRTRRIAQTREAELTVSDTGKGIDEGNLANIFEPFVTTKPDGIGLGLPISRTIIESYGGRIWAENSAAGGANFHFTLPLSQAAS